MGAASGNPSQTGKELYEFGPFRVDAQREILLRAGEPVPLTPKTFQILLVLVRHSQQVVTKDDLMKAVWPDTFVEEANLSRNIFMLRKALGESPQDRRYIVTVPGRGYRLAEDVRLAPEHELSIIAAEHTTVQVQTKETKPWLWLAVLVGLLFVVAAVTVRFSFHRSTVLNQRDTLVLADFTNSTGDPVFDGTLRQGLAVQLEQSPFLSLISDDRIQQTFRMMEQPPDARLTPEVAREVCERTGSTAVLEGSIASLGGEYVLGLRAKKCGTGDIFYDEQAQVARKEDILNALSQIAARFRTRVGESLTTIKEHHTALAEATTPSLGALKAYSTGLKVLFLSGDPAALPFFRRAIELDPHFAMAHAYLGRTYGDLGEADLSAGSTDKAFQLRAHVSDAESFWITAAYDTQVPGNLEKARETCELWAQTYPREMTPHAFLSGIIYPALGQYEEAVQEAKRAIELNPEFAIGYYNLAARYVNLERLDEAEKTLKRASERKLMIPDFLLERYDFAFLKGDRPGMEETVALAQGRSGAGEWISNHHSSVLAYFGQLEQAGSMARYGATLAAQAGHREPAALYKAAAAVWEALFGDALEARRSATAALELSNGRGVEYGAAFALAVLGDSSRSKTLASDMERRFPEDTSVRFSYLPVVRALLALNHGEPAKAIEALQISVPYELGAPRTSIDANFGALYPVYARGEAYLAAHQGAQAAGQFQKILDHRGIVVSDPIGALARLQVARAWALSGDNGKAKAAYQDFLTLWKNADPDIPILRQAKIEYARLQ